MQNIRSHLVRSRLLARLSALLFLLAAVGVIDALQSLARHEYNSVSLVGGETVIITGNLPQGHEDHTTVAFSLESDVPLTFSVTESFSGFWMGGKMWRGVLSSPQVSHETPGTLTISDMWKQEETDAEGKPLLRQNPTLIYPIRIFPDEAALQAADASFFLRTFSLSPFIIALCAAIAALLTAAAQWITFRKADALLGQRGFSFIYGIRTTDGVLEALFLLPAQSQASVAEPVDFFDASLTHQGQGTITTIDKRNATARSQDSSCHPKYGWFVSLKAEPSQPTRH